MVARYEIHPLEKSFRDWEQRRAMEKTVSYNIYLWEKYLTSENYKYRAEWAAWQAGNICRAIIGEYGIDIEIN